MDYDDDVLRRSFLQIRLTHPDPTSDKLMTVGWDKVKHRPRHFHSYSRPSLSRDILHRKGLIY